MVESGHCKGPKVIRVYTIIGKVSTKFLENAATWLLLIIQRFKEKELFDHQKHIENKTHYDELTGHIFQIN